MVRAGRQGALLDVAAKVNASGKPCAEIFLLTAVLRCLVFQ